MKLFLINSCLLVLLMAALGRASVFETGSEDDERMQLRWTCSGFGPCNDPCEDSSGGVGSGTCNGEKCCPNACNPSVVCKKNTPCVANACLNDPACCTECTLGGTDCEGKCVATCSASQKCTCIDGGATNLDACGCTCDPDNCEDTCDLQNGNNGGTCVAGVCTCAPCDPHECDEFCNPGNGGLGGTCSGSTCTCTPCTSSTPVCKTDITVNIRSCGGTTTTTPCGD